MRFFECLCDVLECIVGVVIGDEIVEFFICEVL